MRSALRMPRAVVMNRQQLSGAAAAFGAALRWYPASGKFRLLAGILLTLSAAYGLLFLAVSLSRGWRSGFGDSFALWTWGRFAIEHPAVMIYDPTVLRSAQLALGMDQGGSYSFGYPPSYLLVLWPLAHLSGWIGLVVLMAASLPLYVWATVGRNWRSAASLGVLAAPTTAITIVSGQSSFLAAALLVGGVRLLGERPILAGALFGLLSYKPQLGLLVPVALIAAGAWRAVIAAAVTIVLLCAGTSLLFGVGCWAEWIASLPGFSRYFAAESAEVRHLMPTVLAAASQLGVAPATSQLAQTAVTLATAAVVWVLFRPGPSLLAAAGLLIAALLATPYAFVYDMPLLATAIIWLVAERQRAGGAFGTGEVLVLLLAMLAPMTLAAGHSSFPLAPLALILLLGVVVRAARRPAVAPALPAGRLSAAGSP